MQIHRDGDRLKLSTGEGKPWGHALLLMVPAVVICWAAIGISGWYGAVFAPLVAFIFGRWAMQGFRATVDVDTRFGRIEIERRFVHRTELEKLKVDDVAAFELDESVANDDRKYQPVLVLMNGRRIPIGDASEDREELAEAAQAFRVATGLTG